MNDRPRLSDEDLDLATATVLRARADRVEVGPEEIRARVRAAGSRSRGLDSGWRLVQVLAVAAVLVVGGTIAIAVGGFSARPTPTLPSALASVQTRPSVPASALTLASPSTAVPTPIPPGPDVQFAGLLDPSHGWALTSTGLFLTADGGATWREVKVPGGLATSGTNRVLGVDFFDAQHGWVALNEAFTTGSDASYGRVDVWRTSDGGRSWTKALLPSAVFNKFGEIMPPMQFDFLDARHGFAFLSGNSAKGKNDSDLFWTADGGRTWSADRPTGAGHAGNEGSIGFASVTDGVIVDALAGSGIVVTHDGGRTWTPAALAIPSDSAGAQPFFGQPAFYDGRSGLLAVDFQTDASQLTRVYQTADAGSSWTIRSTVPAGFFGLAFVDQQRWLGTNGPETLLTVDGGQSWVRSGAVGLPGPAGLLMADAQHGWATVHMGVCVSFKSDCQSRTGLYATSDGGASWTALWPR